MNRLVSFSILYFIALANTCVAQLPVLFKEEFNENSNAWPIYESDKYDCAIKDGFYAIKEKSRDGTTFTCIPSSFDPNKDFEIEAKITFKSGSNYGFGLCSKDLRYSKITNEHYFTISQNGYFRLYTYLTDKGDIVHQEWKTDPSVLQGADQTNTLAIKQAGNKTSFLLMAKRSQPYPGLLFGDRK